MSLPIDRRRLLSLLITVLVVGGCYLFVRWQTAEPDDETKAACEAVAANLARIDTAVSRQAAEKLFDASVFDGLSPSERDRFLEESGWSDEDVDHADRVLRRAARELHDAIPEPDETGARAFSFPRSAIFCQDAARKLRRWDFAAAMRSLRSVRPR
jgi:hypothetical protein